MLSIVLASQLANAAPVLAAPTLTRGLPTTLSVTGATAGSTIYFAMSTSGVGPGQCYPNGICLDLLGVPSLLGTAVADASGRASIAPVVPFYAPLGTPVSFQAVQVGAAPAKSGTRTANVVEIPLPTTHCVTPGPDAPADQLVPVTITSFEGYEVRQYIPPNPRGLILYFLGGASLTEIMGNEQTVMLFNRMGGYEHFAVVATERTAGPNAAWDLDPYNQNADAQRINRLRTSIINTTAVDAIDPVVMSGFSDGANMAITMAKMGDDLGWPVIASVPHEGGYGIAGNVPVQFHISENGDVNQQQYQGLQDDLDRAGTYWEEILTPERVVTTTALLREPAWDEADAQLYFDDMVTFGLINAQGVRIVPDNQMDSQLTAYVNWSTLNGPPLAEARMRVLWAMHRFSAYGENQECNFIVDRM